MKATFVSVAKPPVPEDEVHVVMTLSESKKIYKYVGSAAYGDMDDAGLLPLYFALQTEGVHKRV